MSRFATNYRKYIKSNSKGDRYFGFDMRDLAKLEPFLSFLYEDWWKVDFRGIDNLPQKGPALIVGNTGGGLIPWPAFMLICAMMKQAQPRRVHIVADMDWIDDERVYAELVGLGFVPWSSANLKRLFGKGELVAIFPESIGSLAKPFSERYRLTEFDWTRLLPAVEEGVKIFPLTTVGCDEAVPTIANLEKLAKFLGLPSYPITPFFPWFPFPLNMMSLPVHWRMSLLKTTAYKKETNRDQLEETAKLQAKFVEGEIQAEINRTLRSRVKALF